MKADILREKFLDFFKGRKHRVIDSDSLVPKDDPTVLFTPAGMNQFKPQFLGQVTGFTRAATSQRCLRTDDLDKVGHSIGHHTFFEMLGNFSFGDYFKKEAVCWAWEFLTRELGISQDKLWISVYQDDAEAYNIWRDSVKVSAEKIVKLGDKDNFWPAEAKLKGPNGPCGPCSEIFFDFGKEIGCGRASCSPACSCGRFVEVWNLVFTQFNRKEGGVLEPLPRKNIDTGMGLERLSAVMQGVRSNFETDLFSPIIKGIMSGCKGTGVQEKDKKLIYAVADHARAVTFAIFDGVVPSNEGRGYVIRKVIRKAVMHLRGLGIERPYFYKLTAAVAEAMKSPYPELLERRENIAQAILAEERNFLSILDSSATLLGDKFKALSGRQDPEAAGRIAFELYDTYGMPLELTREWLAGRKIDFSQESFDRMLEGQKARSKSQSAMKGDVFEAKDFGMGVKEVKFSGYKSFEAKSRVLAIFAEGKEVKKAAKGQEIKIILDKTPFYPEAGGQAADTGWIVKGKSLLEVTDTQRSGKAIVHIGRVKEGSFRKSDAVAAKIDLLRRMDIARNHTATHLLQSALRKVLGPHVRQQGSLVASDRLRFDFAHFKDIGRQDLERIEGLVNEYILADYPLTVKEMPLAQAKKSGALAFFAEKYDKKVRIVSVPEVSREFCGGTHLASTGLAGLFKIVSEGSVASGVRRIEAVTGRAAYALVKEEAGVLSDIAGALNVPAARIAAEIEKRSLRLKEAEKQLSSQKTKGLESSLEGVMAAAEDISGIKVIAQVLDNLNMDALRRAADIAREKAGSCLVILGSVLEGKAFLIVGLTPDLAQKGLDASSLIRQAAPLIGGSGGGRKDFAQAGGGNPAGLKAAFAKLKELLIK